jgi:hypothetical protein
MYAHGVPVRAILADTACNLDQLYHWLDGLPQPDSGALLPPIPRRKIIVRKLSRATTRVALVTRLMRAVGLQLHGIEQQLAATGYVAGDSERNSRALALLTRTMRELSALDESNRKPPPDAADNDPGGRSLEKVARILGRN